MLLKLYDNQVLNAKGKKGVLTPDADGYRTTVLGAVGCYNTKGEFYLADQSVVDLFDGSGLFMDMVARGLLMAEDEHPMPNIEEGTIDARTGEINLPAYIARLRYYDPDRICAHIKNVQLVSNRDGTVPEASKDAIIILGDTKPVRERGKYLEEAFKNPHENVSFSIRSMTTQETVRGVRYKTIVEVLGFDRVARGGIKGAVKYNSPALESGFEFSPAVVEAIRKASESDMVSLESGLAPIDNLMDYLSDNKVAHTGRRTSSLESW